MSREASVSRSVIWDSSAVTLHSRPQRISRQAHGRGQGDFDLPRSTLASRSDSFNF